LVNFFGGAIFGYNVGVVSGVTRPLIQCTLFKESDNIPLSLYQVVVGFGSDY
jgi:singapore isolate B (sub-type 7) whole genome shotgun sequence assembly, scaffold_10